MSSVQKDKLNEYKRKLFILRQVKAIMSGEDYLIPLEEQKKLVADSSEILTLSKGKSYGNNE